MIKIQKYILFYILFLVMNLFLFFYLNYRVVEREQMYISNGLYSSWNVVLQDSNLSLEEIRQYMPNESRLFLEHTSDGNVRTFYQKGNWQPPLISGTFFELDDNLPQAVVGNNVKRSLGTNNYFNIEDVDYEIVGILGTSFPSPLDNIILLNDIDNSLFVERIVMDTSRGSDIDLIVQEFEVLNINENQALARFLESDILNQLININVIIISSLLIAILSYLYNSINIKNDRIFNLMGRKKIEIFMQHILTLSCLFLGSFLIVLIIDFVIGNKVLLQYSRFYLVVLFLILTAYGLIFISNTKKKGAACDI